MSLLIVTLLTASVCMQTAAEAHEIWGFGGSALFTAGAYATNYAAPPEGAMQVNSKLFSPGGEFPKRETCDGQNTSPQLAWSGAPPATKAFALILDDPDAPGGTFTHWLVWNIPAGTQVEKHCLPSSRRSHDQSSLSFSNGREKVHYPGGVILRIVPRF